MGELEEQIPFLPSKHFESEGQKPIKSTSRKSNWALHGILIIFYTTASIIIILSFHLPESERRRNGKS